jgi:hypothetical protein
MQCLLTTHVRRYHKHYRGSGHVWQGRFKAFPIEADEHYLTSCVFLLRGTMRGRNGTFLMAHDGESRPYRGRKTEVRTVAGPPSRACY